MIPTLMRWQELVRVWIGHWLSRPFHHLFNLMPGLEVGLSAPAITRLRTFRLAPHLVAHYPRLALPAAACRLVALLHAP